jgi:drug/metabolite transporter (DMT)-like permease
MNQRNATLIGCAAILMWAFLAVLSEPNRRVPPFLLSALAFTIASAVGSMFFLRRGQAPLRMPKGAIAVGVFGIFGFHFLYFLAIKNCPIIHAVLINYLWPLLLVLFTAFLPGYGLSWRHIVGALVGFAGAALEVTGGKELSVNPDYILGYLAAAASAVVWALYSVLSRKYKHVPTRSVAITCALSAVLSWICHFLFETTVWPADWLGWLSVLLLGLGPVGLSFYAWDYGMKHGDIRLLGNLSYVDAILTALILSAFGLAEPTAILWIACFLIVVGPLIAVSPTSRREGHA